jgi:hypothetical protein
MMTLTLAALEICVRALKTRESSCIDRPASFFFMIKDRGPQRTTGRVVASDPSRQEVGFGVVGHVEPSLIVRRNLES